MTRWQAQGNFYADVLRASPQFRSTDVVRRLDMLEPSTRRRVLAIIGDAAAAQLPLAVAETFRSRERQAVLYEAGVTQLPTVGTHHFGLACDLVRVQNGVPIWDGDYTLLGDLARRHGMVWGGDWGNRGQPASFVDATHLQRCAVSDQEALFAERWYPDEEYDPYH